MSYLAWAPSAYDNTSLAPEDRRRGVWSYDSKDERVARRDPSGYVTPAPEPARPGLLADIPPVAPATPASAPPFSPLASPPASPEKSGMTTTKASFEFTRRGQRCGDIGWGVSAAPPKSSVDWGRRDGAAAVSADLLKRNMFMKLSGDPNFDTKQGRFVQMPMRSLDPSLRRK